MDWTTIFVWSVVKPSIEKQFLTILNFCEIADAKDSEEKNLLWLDKIKLKVYKSFIQGC